MLTPKEDTVLKSVAFDRRIGELLDDAMPAEIERLQKLGDNNEVALLEGVSVLVADGEAAEEVMKRIQPSLLHLGYRAFWSNRVDARGRRQGDEVVVLKTDVKYALLTLCETNGVNHDIGPADVIEKLKSWEEICDFDVVGAEQDWVALQFQRLPEDISSFARDVYSFCPDSVEQGTGLLKEESDPERFAAARQLCPDIKEEDYPSPQGLDELKSQLPPEMQKQMEESMAVFSAAMGDAFKHSTSTAMGVRLLGEEIFRTRYLFLWWD